MSDTQLNYKALHEVAEDEAKKSAALMYPPGLLQDDMIKRLTAKYYAQYTRPPMVWGRSRS